ncbi:haloacid dehalogenase type II [Lampropedia puyangensis]|uniref:Haloacid dehalogenase type II n=1 Tax=Lampropedia puyangensis TaxID=1330072 RepID=A0A4S8F5V6_9BURK|nr:haloacid dehalogenase type II [Lampropedia puyangensis]THU01534.1 haloacid dehalogenase type II [Lampropedia puyangensis]
MHFPKALAFDVFGTVVDWHTSIAREVQPFVQSHLPAISPSSFALDWRKLYQPAMRQCHAQGRPFVALDILHFETLRALLQQYDLDPDTIPEATLWHMAHAWRRLDPWPDVPQGLAMLRQAFPVVTLSNANIALMVAMNRHNGLQWDAILGAELAKAYKPEPAAYLSTAAALGVQPHELCLVACHHSDLAAARACGLKTAYIDRPMEYGGAPAPDAAAIQHWDWHAPSVPDLAQQLCL